MEQTMSGVSSNKKTLSTFEASAIITGYGIGGGVMAMPVLVNKVGIIMAIGILLIALIANYLMHLMIADLVLKCGKDSQIIDIFNKFIFKGKAKKVLTIIVFAIVALVLYANLAVYIAGAGEIINKLFPQIPLIATKFIFYGFALLTGFFGLKILGISEKYTIIVIFGMVIALMVGSCFNIKNTLSINVSGFRDVLAYLGVAMFAFIAFFSIPQVVNGLDGDKKKINKSIIFGMLMNLLIILIVVIFSLLSASDVTKDDAPFIIYWAQGIGPWAEIVGNIFVLLAMLTTYWSISFALRDIIKSAIHKNNIICILIATIPALLISIIPSESFIKLLDLTAGAIAILIGIFVIPAFFIARRKNNNESMLGKFGSLPFQIFTVVMFILMAVGSII